MNTDTSDKLDEILVNLYLGGNTTEKIPNWKAQMKNPELAEAKTALQALIARQVTAARNESYWRLAKLSRETKDVKTGQLLQTVGLGYLMTELQNGATE